MNRPLKRRVEFPRLSWKIIFLIPIYSCVPALADSDLVPADIIPPPDVLIPAPDAITPYAGFGIGYDDNVLRLPNAAAGRDMGLDGLSDVTRRLEFGLALDKKISQQRVTANLNVTKVDYDRFTQLDHLDKNLGVNWNWHVGNHVEGNAGVNYSQGLTPFIDFHLLEPNIRTQTNEYVDGAWLFHPSWRVRAGLVHSKLWYDLPSQQPGNNSQNQSELGLDYLARSGSTIGLQLRHTRADFPNPEQDGSTLIYNGYNQDEAKAKIDWLVTGKTRLHFLGGWVSRKQDAFPVRNFSGLNSRLSADWSPTGKIDVSAAIWREIAAVDDLSNVYSLNRGASLASAWKYSDKIRLVAQVKYEKRDFSQSSASGTLAGPTSQNDTLRNVALTLVYNPTLHWDLRLSAIRSTQTASAGSGGFVSNGVLFTTRYAF
jgi:exopolysaccharide biosynthesis operon protein EpsL